MQHQMPASEAGFKIRSLAPDDIEPVLKMLTDAFGPGFDRDWFDWKHRGSPWGPSLGWVAYDTGGLLGVRLFLPWRFRARDRMYTALRPCDTVTSPTARGRGIFRSLTQHAVSSLDKEVDFLFSTPNEKSRPGLLKMGFVEWGQVRQRLSHIRPRRVELTDHPEPVDNGLGVSTEIDDRFLAWRYAACPRQDYASFGLSGETGGLVCRVRNWHGMKLMVVSELWGNARQKAMLVDGAGHELGARMAWLGAPFPKVGFPLMGRPGTVVTRYDLGISDPGPLTLSIGDIEDVL